MAEIFLQLILATFFGALIGLEREIKRKQAGLQTYSLVCFGSCLFTIFSFELFSSLGGDPLRIIQAIAIGIGFIGAGVIFRQGSGIVGLTTAAGLWATAAIGISVGAKFYYLSAFSTVLTLLILAGFGALEEKFLKERK